MNKFEKDLKIAQISLKYTDLLFSSGWFRETMVKEGPRTYWYQDPTREGKVVYKKYRKEIEAIEKEYEEANEAR